MDDIFDTPTAELYTDLIRIDAGKEIKMGGQKNHCDTQCHDYQNQDY
ncbi:MAG: hypothetical protein Q7U74_03315 [Saprospiraceae bacterium]|nr:hypothetical protein [Saprospiraceae bacterium]